MKVKQMLSQNRRDFTAMLVCEHCGVEDHLNSGYDDANYHQNVIPAMKCKACGKAAPSDHTPQATKYAAHEVV